MELVRPPLMDLVRLPLVLLSRFDGNEDGFSSSPSTVSESLTTVDVRGWRVAVARL